MPIPFQFRFKTSTSPGLSTQMLEHRKVLKDLERGRARAFLGVSCFETVRTFKFTHLRDLSEILVFGREEIFGTKSLPVKFSQGKMSPVQTISLIFQENHVSGGGNLLPELMSISFFRCVSRF